MKKIFLIGYIVAVVFIVGCSSSKYMPTQSGPVPIKQVSAIYPEIAERVRVEGTVWVKLLIDKEGKVRKAEVEKTDAEILNEPAIEAALQWEFNPANLEGRPDTVWATYPFVFELK